MAYHLEVLIRHRDLRGVLRLTAALPRHYVQRGWWKVRMRDDYPLHLLIAEVQGSLAGVPAWLLSRRERGRVDR